MGGRKNENKDNNKGKNVKGSKENEKEKKRHKQKDFQESKEFLKHLKEFNEELLAYNMQIRDVKGDGNCLFRSISEQIEGNENIHMFYRKIAVEEMEKEKNFFKNFIFDEDFDTYLQQMNSSGNWGGNLEIQAISHSQGHNFIIHRKGQPHLVIKGKAVKGIQKKTIHLAFHNENEGEEHYSSIRNIGDNTDMPAHPIKHIKFLELEKQLSYTDCIDDVDEENESQLESKEKSKKKDQSQQMKKGQSQDLSIKKSSKNSQSSEIKPKTEKQQIQEQKTREKEENDLIKKFGSINIDEKEQEEEKKQDKVVPGRNTKCPCKSGKAYKNCCLTKDSHVKQQQTLANQSIMNKGIVFI